MVRKRGALDYRLHKICANPECEKKFSTNRINKKHCCPPCRHRAWLLASKEVQKKTVELLVEKIAELEAKLGENK